MVSSILNISINTLEQKNVLLSNKVLINQDQNNSQNLIESQIKDISKNSLKENNSQNQSNLSEYVIIYLLSNLSVSDSHSLRINKYISKIIDQNKNFLLQEMVFKRKSIEEIIDFLKHNGQLIQELNLMEFKPQITAAQFKLIIQLCPKLKAIFLNYQLEIRDESLIHLKQLNNLNHLTLLNCINITDQGLEHLRLITNLEKINMAGCFKITNKGIKFLKGLKQLKEINLEWCQKISIEGYNLLKQNHPNLKIISNFQFSSFIDQPKRRRCAITMMPEERNVTVKRKLLD